MLFAQRFVAADIRLDFAMRIRRACERSSQILRLTRTKAGVEFLGRGTGAGSLFPIS